MTIGINTRPTDEELASWMPNTPHSSWAQEGHRGAGSKGNDPICRCDFCAKLRREFWEQQSWIP